MVQLEERTLAGLHLRGVVELRVIVAEHVQDTVHDEQGQLVVEHQKLSLRRGSE